MAIAESGLQPIIAGAPVGHEVLDDAIRVVRPQDGSVNGREFSVLQGDEADLSPFIPADFAIAVSRSIG